jgi:hypothetical protein
MEEPKKSLRFSPRVETRLASADIKRLETAAEKAGQTRADLPGKLCSGIWIILRTWSSDKREAEVAQAMRYATDQHVKAINSGR